MNKPVDHSSISVKQRRRFRLHAGAMVLTLSLVPLAVKSVTNISDGLSAGSAPASNLVYSANAAAGINNTVYGVNAFVAGDGNTVYGYDGNFAAGKGNYVNGWSNGAIGCQNSISADGNGGYYSFAWGAGNQILAHVKLATAAGYGNIVSGDQSHTIGSLLQNYSMFSTVLGVYNKAVNNDNVEAAARSTWRPDDSILVVGNGSATEPSNALVVTKGGMTHIEVPPKGGISMGAYTAR